MTNMNRIMLPTALLVACLCLPLPSRAQLPRMADAAGTYVSCDLSCSTITLTEGGRFDFVVDGDLFNNLQARGSWRFDESGHILLTTDEQPQITEAIGPVEDRVRLKVVDQNGDVPASDELGGPYGTVYCPEPVNWGLDDAVWIVGDESDAERREPSERHPMIRDPDGYIVIPDCQPSEFWVGLLGYPRNSVRHSPRDEASNEFVFVLDTGTDFYLKDETYGWRSGCLYYLDFQEEAGECSGLELRRQ